MKHLLYYNSNEKFITDQRQVGGDGKKVVSVVDGVAWTNDMEKVYYRPANNDSENLTSYTVTLHFKDINDNTVAPDKTINVDAYVSKSAAEVIVPEYISGYTSINGPEKIIISANTEYTFIYTEGGEDFRQKLLTFNIISSGTIYWKATTQSVRKTIEYMKNNSGTWVSILSSTGGVPLSVNAGDVLQFRGNNTAYGDYTGNYYNSFSGSTAIFEIEGNIMSLIDPDHFVTATTISSNFAFNNMFCTCPGLIAAKNLVLPATTLSNNCYNGMFRRSESLVTAPELPATTLSNGCYNYMFQGCSSLIEAPELPATNLTYECYYYMLYGCTSLKYIKCLAKKISATRCTYAWVGNVASSGVFVKDQSMSSWTRGDNGIPTNWVVQNAS